MSLLLLVFLFMLICSAMIFAAVLYINLRRARRSIPRWQYGYFFREGARGNRARRNLRTGEVETRTFKKGDQAHLDGVGHTEDKYYRCGAGHEQFFVPDE